MKLGYTIIYVPNVAASLSFFDAAFGHAAFCMSLGTTVNLKREKQHSLLRRTSLGI